MIETIAFILGAVVGGIISNYAFEKPKNLYNEFLEIVIFYLIAFILSERVSVGWISFIVIGFFSAIIARAVSSKMTPTKIQKKIKVGKIGILIGLLNALRRRGFKEDEIKKIAIEAGFTKEEIREVIK